MKQVKVINTADGQVYGHFIGSIEYAVAGDPVNGFETERMVAFATDDGQVFGTIKDGSAWKLYPMEELGGILHQGEFPLEWE